MGDLSHTLAASVVNWTRVESLCSCDCDIAIQKVKVECRMPCWKHEYNVSLCRSFDIDADTGRSSHYIYIGITWDVKRSIRIEKSLEITGRTGGTPGSMHRLNVFHAVER
jgi:hypothetical protein